MDPELNEEGTGNGALDESTQALVEAAFDAGFSNTTEGKEPAAASAPAEPPAAAPAPASAPVAAPAPAPAVDPYADLPPAVRDGLAKLTELTAEVTNLKRQAGQVPHLRSEIEKLRKGAAAPAPAPEPQPNENPALERVRGELPEVADAIEEVLRNRAPAPPPAAAPAAPAADEGDRLNETMNNVYPGWDEKMMSTDFKLWLGRQPSDIQETMATTNDIGVVVKHLRTFDSFQNEIQASAAAALANAQRTQNRRQASVAPVRGRPAPVLANQTEEDAFEAGFNAVRAGTG